MEGEKRGFDPRVEGRDKRGSIVRSRGLSIILNEKFLRGGKKKERKGWIDLKAHSVGSVKFFWGFRSGVESESFRTRGVIN